MCFISEEIDRTDVEGICREGLSALEGLHEDLSGLWDAPYVVQHDV